MLVELNRDAIPKGKEGVLLPVAAGPTKVRKGKQFSGVFPYVWNTVISYGIRVIHMERSIWINLIHTLMDRKPVGSLAVENSNQSKRVLSPDSQGIPHSLTAHRPVAEAFLKYYHVDHPGRCGVPVSPSMQGVTTESMRWRGTVEQERKEN